MINDRYDEVVFETNGGASFGMGPDGKAPFEREGTMPLPEGPFMLLRRQPLGTRE
ncbi:hypothetical protein [Polyangium sp. 6x1]|uniref:hypothetical protein n=1 Tax=Polyangium sp. 6x1 TaxID=3042689 RepID=UPI0024824D51|nr:hypothetical protein [Polyangium sp. 6x1]MDI1450938.1 hypothetical protein [Polyangium sp. 6x1]